MPSLIQMSDPIPVFGRAVPGVDYTERPGAYGFAFDTFGRILVVHGRWGCFLPGGGFQDGEDALICLARETEEELGAVVTASSFICEGAQYFGPFEDGSAFLKRERFCAVSLDRINIEAQSDDHRPEWQSLEDAQQTLTEDCQRWAVAQMMKRCTDGSGMG